MNKFLTVSLSTIMCIVGSNIFAVDNNDSNFSFSKEKRIFYTEKTTKNIEQLFIDIQSLYTPLGTNVLDTQKLCDIAYLYKMKKLLNQAATGIEKCQASFFQTQHNTLTQLLDKMSFDDEERIFITNYLENDKGDKLLNAYCTIHKSIMKKAKEFMEFCINNHGHYRAQNQQLLFDSTDRLKKSSALLEEIASLQIKENNFMNSLRISREERHFK
ncbi:MAG: hypothetical protein P0S95_07720 [Rhabdochlamydiaceae bacterium]|nr:hypothetical protein [Candidatus Amphrikana amoebophyrae]